MAELLAADVEEERPRQVSLLVADDGFTLDDIYDSIGHCGPLHSFLTLMMGLTAVNMGMHTFMPIFLHYEPMVGVPGNSTQYVKANTAACNEILHIVDSGTNITYDESVFTSTIVTEYDLICTKSNLAQLESATTVYFVGQICASVLAGIVGDNLGRRIPVLISTITVSAACVTIYLSQSFTVYAVGRFFLAFGMFGSLNAFILLMEIIGPKYRQIVGTGVQSFFASGQLLLTVLAYYMRDWRDLQKWSVYLTIPTIGLYFIIPESPRYQIATGRSRAAFKTFKKLGKSNDIKPEEMEKVFAQVNSLDAQARTLEKKTTVVSYLHLFDTRFITKVTIKVAYLWLATGLSFYAVSLNISKMKGDIFIQNSLSALAELISCLTLAPYLATHYPFRFSLSLCYGVGAASFVVSWLCTIYDSHWVLIAILANVGKLFVSGAFSLIYNYTVAVFPTILRGNAISLTSTAARVGSSSIMLLNLAQKVIEERFGLAQTILVMISTITAGAAFVILTLPEIFGKPLIQTREDAEKLYKSSS